MTIDLRGEVRLADEALALDWYKDNGYTNIGEVVCAIKYGYIKNNSLTYSHVQHEINYLVEQLKFMLKIVILFFLYLVLIHFIKIIQMGT